MAKHVAIPSLAGLLLACGSVGDDGDFESLGGQPSEGGGGDTEVSSEDSGPSDSGGPLGCQSDDECNGGHCDSATGNCYPECTPGDNRSCYEGPSDTENVGACTSGMQTCEADGRWNSWCGGQVLPSAEVCDNELDDDCDGQVDDADQDGDGFGVCSGDCCDVEGASCNGAALVNPGAFEVDDNQLDDDCDGDIDEVATACDDGLASDIDDPFELVQAMDLCATTEEEPNDPAERTWGVITARLSLADGTGSPRAVQAAVRDGFGDHIEAERGASLAVLSSGHAADAADDDPEFAPFQAGRNLGTSSPGPVDWLAAHDGSFPNAPGCGNAQADTANDPVMLTIRMRAPTNARSFSVMTHFFSAEYPEWVCSQYNDFFVALVDSAADNPSDRNIATYDDGDTRWPVGVNLVMLAEGLFTQCQNGRVGCAENMVTEYEGCVGDVLLEGTGFDADDDGCFGDQDQVGGATGWLRMTGNVLPGEVFEIRFAVWDTGGHIFDSLVLLDDWQWSVDAAEPGVTPG